MASDIHTRTEGPLFPAKGGVAMIAIGKRFPARIKGQQLQSLIETSAWDC